MKPKKNQKEPKPATAPVTEVKEPTEDSGTRSSEVSKNSIADKLKEKAEQYDRRGRGRPKKEEMEKQEEERRQLELKQQEDAVRDQIHLALARNVVGMVDDFKVTRGLRGIGMQQKQLLEQGIYGCAKKYNVQVNVSPEYCLIVGVIWLFYDTYSELKARKENAKPDNCRFQV